VGAGSDAGAGRRRRWIDLTRLVVVLGRRLLPRVDGWWSLGRRLGLERSRSDDHERDQAGKHQQDDGPHARRTFDV
jgi:hypothetical protein